MAQRLAQVLYTHKAGGSNPSSPTTCFVRLPVMGAFRFWAHRRGIRTRQGAELRKRVSVFQRSTRGPKARSGSGRRSRTRISLIAHHLIEKAPSDGSLSFLGPSQRDSNPQGAPRFKGSGQKMSNMSTAAFLVTAFSRFQRAYLTSKQRITVRMGIFLTTKLDICGPTRQIASDLYATHFVPVLIFGIFW